MSGAKDASSGDVEGPCQHRVARTLKHASNLIEYVEIMRDCESNMCLVQVYLQAHISASWSSFKQTMPLQALDVNNFNYAHMNCIFIDQLHSVTFCNGHVN